MTDARLTRSLIAAAWAVLGASAANAADPGLALQIEGLTQAGKLPLSSAFCLPASTAAKAMNTSPGLHWSAGPDATASYVLLMVDPDVPRQLPLLNMMGVSIAADAPRMDIYHWVLTDIPPDVHGLAPGIDGDAFVPGGKPTGRLRFGVRGTNDYWPYFNRNPNVPPAMRGPYAGYDGPCPPMNDAKTHDYRFTVYALDVPSLGLSGQFFAVDVLKAMKGHVLAQGEAKASFTFDGK